MLEADHTRSVRVQAPIAMVWDELSSLDRLMKQIPEVAHFRLEGDGRSAQISTGLTWGPLKWKLATATLEGSDPPRHLEWRSLAPALRLDFEGSFDLAPTAAGDATVLTYHGVIRCRHKLVGRLRGALATALEGHVNDLADRLATLAAQHAEAQARLGMPPGPVAGQ